MTLTAPGGLARLAVRKSSVRIALRETGAAKAIPFAASEVAA